MLIYFSTFTQTSSSQNKKIYSVKKVVDKKIHNFSNRKLEEKNALFQQKKWLKQIWRN